MRYVALGITYNNLLARVFAKTAKDAFIKFVEKYDRDPLYIFTESEFNRGIERKENIQEKFRVKFM